MKQRGTFPASVIFFLAGFFFLVIGIAVFSFHNRAVMADVPVLSPLASGDFSAHGVGGIFGVRHRRERRTTDAYPPSSFFPISSVPVDGDPFDISVQSYAVFDLDTRNLLYGRNVAQPAAIASLAKVMTALVALEQAPLDLVLTVSSAAANIGEATMGLSAGERVSVEDLLFGILLPSGNDAAEALAEGIGKFHRGIPASSVDGGGSRAWFLEQMNKKAESLGMYDTYFFNPSGLDEDTLDTTSFSTALDLLALGDYALRNPVFSRISSTGEHYIPYKDGYHKAFFLKNILGLSESYRGIQGIKPGNSFFSNETLLSYITRDGRRLLVSILGSSHTKDDVLKIYTTLFSSSP